MSELGCYTARLEMLPIVDGPCASCIGACCLGNIIMPLTRREKARLEKVGAIFEEPTTEEKTQAGYAPWHKPWRMVGECPNLDSETKACKDYSRRPGVCGSLIAGGALCNEIREAHGLEPAERTVPVLLGMPGMPPAPERVEPTSQPGYPLAS